MVTSFVLGFRGQIQQGPGSKGNLRREPGHSSKGWGLAKASLTHGLKHQVNIPVVLRWDYIEQADDVGMAPKLLGRQTVAAGETRAMFWATGDSPSPVCGDLHPGKGTLWQGGLGH